VTSSGEKVIVDPTLTVSRVYMVCFASFLLQNDINSTLTQPSSTSISSLISEHSSDKSL